MNSKPAGNLMSVMMKLTEQEKENGSYEIAGTTFAQFIKGDFDFRYYRKLDREKDKLVFLFFTGIGQDIFPTFGLFLPLGFNEGPGQALSLAKRSARPPGFKA